MTTSSAHTATTPQRGIGSGFDSHSTAAEVVRGIDLSGRLAIVTGGYSGVGLETTRALVGAGAHVVVPARRREVAEQALAGIDRVEIDELDLADLASVREFARRFLESGRHVDILINGAGIMACPETRVGPGWEAQFATNHLGHYTLANLLWPALANGGGARVVAVTSGVPVHGSIQWDDLHLTGGYDKWQAYVQSKAANTLFAAQLDTLGQAAGVRAFTVNPGYILTPLQRHLSKEEMTGAGWIDEDGNPLLPEFRSPEQGAASQVWAATSAQLAGMGGVYCQHCDIADLDRELHGEEAQRLWTVSAELTGVDAFATD